jgi:hypothetical protein
MNETSTILLKKSFESLIQNDTYKLDVNGNVNVSGGMRITSYITGNNGITSQQTFVYLKKV